MTAHYGWDSLVAVDPRRLRELDARASGPSRRFAGPRILLSARASTPLRRRSSTEKEPRAGLSPWRWIWIVIVIGPVETVDNSVGPQAKACRPGDGLGASAERGVDGGEIHTRVADLHSWPSTPRPQSPLSHKAPSSTCPHPVHRWGQRPQPDKSGEVVPEYGIETRLSTALFTDTIHRCGHSCGRTAPGNPTFGGHPPERAGRVTGGAGS